jgi:hypothetical protein
MRSERLLVASVAGALLATAGCSSPESYVVLSLSATSTPIVGVTNIEVDVSNGISSMRMLTYAAHGATIDQTMVNTLSVGFSSSESGSITFNVKALDSLGCTIGTGGVKTDIKKGGVVTAPVTLSVAHICTQVDGGAPEVADGSTLPGCDPVNPQSTAAGVTTCGSTQTCQVDCTPPDAGAPRNECIAGGGGPAGTVCHSNADCQPGTQCFNYSNTGCNVSLCLRYCGNDADCAPVGAGGGGPGSFCQGPVMCPAFLTAYHTCTFNCDPRATAAAAKGGCPGGLACVMPGDHDEVDCACPEPTRTKAEGATCTSAADCMPGLICNRMNGSLTCRPICRCDANASGACTATANDCPTAGTTCHAVTNNTIYGICLP